MPENKLGVARGIIEIVTTQVSKSTKVIQRDSQQASQAIDAIGDSADKSTKKIGTSFAGIGKAVERARSSLQQFDGSNLGKLQKTLDGVAGKIAGISAASAAAVTGGIFAANNLKRTQVSLELLSGSAEKAQRIMDTTRSISDEFGAPYLELLEGARAFLPIAKTTGAEIEDLLKLSLKFQAYNPAKSMDEIKFSINEAISGDFVSIKDALDLSKAQREDLKKRFEETGAGGVLEGINEILSARGFDDATLQKFGDSGVNAFANLKDSIQELMAEAFMPLLNDVIVPGVQKFTEFVRNIREGNPELLKVGAAFTAAAAAAAPLMTLVTTMIAGFKSLKAVSAGLNLAEGLKSGKGAGGVLGKGLAVGAGVGVGLAGATALANAGVESGDLGRIKAGEDAGAVLAERLKQIVVIVTAGLLDLAKIVAKVVISIGTAIETIINAGRSLLTYIKEFGGNINKFVGELLIGLAQLLAQIPGADELAAGVLTEGDRLRASGQMQTAEAQSERDFFNRQIATTGERLQQRFDESDKFLDEAKNNILTGLTNFLFPIEEKAAETAAGLDDAGALFDTPPQHEGDTEEYLAKQAEEIAAATKQYSEDIQAIEEDKNKALIDLNKRYADEQVSIAQDRAKAEEKALQDLIQDRNKMRLDFEREGQEAERDLSRDRRDALIEFQRGERDAAVDHAAKLQAIRNKAQEREKEALQKLDFAALFDLSEQTNTEMAAEETDYQAQRQERSQALQDELSDMQQAFADERQERQIKFQQDLMDRSAAYQLERQQIQKEYQERLAEAAQNFQLERQQIMTEAQEKLRLRHESARKELEFLAMTEAQRSQVMLAEQQKYLAQAQAMFANLKIPQPQAAPRTAAQQQQANQRSIQNTQTQRQILVQQEKSGTTRVGIGGQISGRAKGGSVQANTPYVVNEGFRGQMERFISAAGASLLPGGAGLLMPFQSGKIDPNTGGTGGRQIVLNPTYNIHEAADYETVKSAIDAANADLLSMLAGQGG
jgi:hypothetical protein